MVAAAKALVAAALMYVVCDEACSHPASWHKEMHLSDLGVWRL